MFKISIFKKMPYGKNKNARLACVVVLDFGNLNFGFVSSFDIRISDLM